MNFLRKNKKALIMLAIALAVILVSSFCASMIQSDAFRVKVTDLRNETNSGTLLGNDSVKVSGKVTSGILFVPNTATEETPAPGIVLTHGYLNNRELQLQNAIELARRGFVVITIDRGQHGNNQNDIGTGSLMNTDGMYESAKYLYNLPYVDKEAGIGISGHSMGGYTTAATLVMDSPYHALLGYENPERGDPVYGLGIISAGLMQGWSTFMTAGPGVSVGMLKAQDDEFFFVSKFADGSDAICREFLHTVGAASFVGLTGYGNTKDAININSGDIYVNGSVVTVEQGTKVDGPFRVIYEANEIHPLNHFSVESAGYVTDFFYNAYGTPAGHSVIKSTSQTWWLKETFSLIGLIAVFFMLFPLISILLSVPCFASLAKSEEVDLDADLLSFKKGGVANIVRTVLFWLAAAGTMFFGGFIMHKVFTEWGSELLPVTTLLPQNTTGNVAAWGIVSAIFGIAVLLFVWLVNSLVNYFAAKKGQESVAVTNPFRPAIISWANLVKTVCLAFLVVAVFYVVTWINWGIWTVDFRIWTLNVHPFRLNMLGTMLRYIPLFLIFYGVNALANAGMRAKELPEWASVAINAAFNCVGVLLVVLIQYGTFRATGVLWQADMNLAYIVVFPLIPILAIATIISRYTYKRTGNIWLGALINAILFTIMTVANTAHQYPYI
ncbi:MAG: hypothetical protein J1F68_02340 [Clostridiales bacterium]|nr:hypothetical protein [Clostridiales bacterium]